MASQKVPQSPDPKPQFFFGYIIVLAAFCVMAVTWGARNAYGVFFEPLLTEFGWTRSLISGAFSLGMIMMGLMGIAMGGLTDRIGPRVVTTLSGLFAGSGFMLMSQVSDIWQLYLFFGVIVGIGMGATRVPLMSTVARWFFQRRNTMTAVILVGSGVGALIIPVMASWLISTYDWRTACFILGILVLAVVISAGQFLKRDPSSTGQVPYGKNKVTEQDLKIKPEGFSLREAIRTRQFWLACAMFLCEGVCLYTIIVHIVPHTIQLGFSATSAATVLSGVGGLAIVGRIGLGSAADKIGNTLALIIGFVLMAASLFWLAVAEDIWMLYVCAAGVGFAQGGIGVLESTIIARLFGLTSHGLIFGVIAMTFTIGAAFGPLMAGYLFDTTGSYQLAFFVCGIFSIAGMIVSKLITPIKEGQRRLAP
jgi:MFS family permease